jgi:glutaminyl-tRNA synthetase
MSEVRDEPVDFIRQKVKADLASGRVDHVVTRFPPEPNGYLHIGHAKAILISYGIARDFGGRFHLRFDDTNPAAEETEYVEGMLEDLRWLGADWGEHLYFTSGYFQQLHDFAVELIRRGKAFVCDLSSEEIEAHRGTLTEPGRPSPYRERGVEENLDLFARMRAGEFAPGEHVLRAKIDMASSVLPMRDPLIYRIVAGSHHRTGDAWPIYPLYDFAHGLSDAIEGITHSLCSLEFASHRPLYDWFLEALDLPLPRPEQTEFSRLNLSHTLMSKRQLRRLVEEGHVSGWDDPRMPTLVAMRRRGIPPEAIRRMVEGIGVARRDNVIELARLEYEVREQLNREAPRRLGVVDPLKLVIENYPDGESDVFEAANHPQDPSMGTRQVPFGKTLWIEREDFAEEPPGKWKRLAPGREIRLRYAYLVTCTGVEKDADGTIREVRCRYDPATRGGDAPDGRKVKGTIHWVSAEHAVPAEVRLYDVLFEAIDPMDVPEGADVLDGCNPASLVVQQGWLEPSLGGAAPGGRFQLERLGYFCVDPDSRDERLVLSRTVTLRDSFARGGQAPRAGKGGAARQAAGSRS